MISIIVATSKNGIIGKDNAMPWHLPQDLSYFYKMTVGKNIVMGRKTFQSIGNPLPKRNNIILTRDTSYVVSGCTIIHSIEEILKLGCSEEIMVIGGGEIYQMFLPYTDTIYHTLIDIHADGDTEFIIPQNFKECYREEHFDGSIENNQNVKYSFRTLKRTDLNSDGGLK